MSEQSGDEFAKKFPPIKTTSEAYRSRGSLPIPKSLTSQYHKSQPNLSRITTDDHNSAENNDVEFGSKFGGTRKPSMYHRSSGTIKIEPFDDTDVDVEKRTPPKVTSTQNIYTKYLKPTPLTPPGDLILEQEADKRLPPEPPLHIIQETHKKSEKKVKQEPIIIRDKPMRKPEPIPEKVIRLPGKVLPPPARQIIVERLPPPPRSPPPDIIYEKWLPYDELPPRRVRYIPAPAQLEPLPPPPRNILIEWEAPDVEITKNYVHLGTETMNPDAYAVEHNLSFIECTSRAVPKLVGDVEYLKFIDLDAYGLSEYKEQVNNYIKPNGMMYF
jgi:hypothetical protein